MAIPFLRAASRNFRVTLLAKPHAEPILARFAPDVELIPLEAPWTAFKGKYRLLFWPWGALAATMRTLRHRHFSFGVSARPDPRDHLLLTLAGVGKRVGFPRSESGVFLTRSLGNPAKPGRAAHWQALAQELGLELDVPVSSRPRSGRCMVIHVGAGQPTRRWPVERFNQVADGLRRNGWDVDKVDDSQMDLAALIERLDLADRFVGNDSGPGHLAALLGIPTFTIFGPQLPELFAPGHPRARWIEGGPCAFKPCWDNCRFSEPHCLLSVTTGAVSAGVDSWLSETSSDVRT